MPTALSYTWLLIEGAGITLEVSTFALALSIVLGAALGMLSTAPWKPARFVARLYVEVVRSVPVLVIVFFAYYGLPVVTDLSVSPYVAATGTLAAYGGVYMAEVVRSGIQAVDLGQWDAARALGLRYTRVLRLVVLPQAIRVMVPAGIGVFINLVKESSVTSVIGFVELTQTAINIRNTIFSLTPILLAGLLYFVLCFTLSRVGRTIEAKPLIGSGA